MTAEQAVGLPLGKCLTCHVRFVPVDGGCPKCGSAATERYVSAGVGTVLSATALENPPPGWERPHLLAFVEVEDGVRLLVVPGKPLPAVGSEVVVRESGGVYRARLSATGGEKRGEGDVPAAGATRPPFEPPR